MGISAKDDNIIVFHARPSSSKPYRLGAGKPSPAQRDWLTRGLSQSAGKLPLFDDGGQRINDRTVRACIRNGWAEPWFDNPLKPNWLVCKITDEGLQVLGNFA